MHGHQQGLGFRAREIMGTDLNGGGGWSSRQGDGWRRKQDHQSEMCLDVGPSQALAEEGDGEQSQRRSSGSSAVKKSRESK